jgi:hypothetical protein
MEEITKKFIIDHMIKIMKEMYVENYDIEMICGSKKGFSDLCKVLGISDKFLQEL